MGVFPRRAQGILWDHVYWYFNTHTAFPQNAAWSRKVQGGGENAAFAHQPEAGGRVGALPSEIGCPGNRSN